MRLTSAVLRDHVRLAIVGGGSGGSAVAAKFSRILGASNVAVIEPKATHYYQPGFTLVGGGLMKLDSLIRSEESVLPQGVNLIRSKLSRFEPENNKLHFEESPPLAYDYLVIATGVELRYDLIKNLPSALETPGVCSIYLPQYAEKTFKEIQSLQKGNALFTFPNTPIKCAGAPQKICYIAEDYWRRNSVRQNIHISYNTSLGAIFGIPKYAASLMKQVESRGIELNTRTNLIEVDPEKKQATFELLNAEAQPTGKTIVKKYDLLHVGPPCSPVPVLREAASANSPLVDGKGWVKVHPKTLQNETFNNVFGIGDCANTPNAKTAAAISSQFRALEANLTSVIAGKQPVSEYDGYASCPLVINHNQAILAEFNGDGPLETLPIDQSKPRYLAYFLKRYFMPALYWQGLVKGYWKGPKVIRKLLHLGFSK
uniref:Sulfide:quinone oxidoreductase, mitochondrial n=1 Tax=Panagrellus redivivus TaxID=6233 RepID=A0A7E4VXU3_PANRE